MGKVKQLADRRGGRCFGQDLMRGEHVVGYPGANKANAHLDEKTQRGLGAYMAAAGATIERNAGGQTGTSIFDPVLCELVYRWFCPPLGIVLDPFAGGSVRGVVASKLGRPYVGVDLRPEQLSANEEQAARICDDPMPVWKEGDSRKIDKIVGNLEADLVFSCPPYADLEVYSDDERDLSTMPYDEFVKCYREIVEKSCKLLKEDRFACFVVGDIRDKKGFYRGLPWHTIQAFQDAGLKLYNEAVLVTAVGSLPIRVGKQFTAGRKLGKTHQNVLVFCKGNPKKATGACGKIEIDPALLADPAEQFGEVL